MRSSPRMARRVFLSVMSWAKRIVLGVALRQRHRALEKNEKLRQGTDGLRETALYQIGPGEERGGYGPHPLHHYAEPSFALLDLFRFAHRYSPIVAISALIAHRAHTEQ